VFEIIRDLMKANRVSQEGPVQDENLVVVHPSNPLGMQAAVDGALAWLRRWHDMRVAIAVDIETSGLSLFGCKLFSIALAGCDGSNTAVVFTLHDLHTMPWEYERALTKKLAEILADPTTPKLFHNAPFDMAVLVGKKYQINGPMEDTLALAHIVQPDGFKDLGWVGHTYLDVEPWKLNHQTGKKMAQTDDVISLLVYNAKDALNTAKLRACLYDEITARGMGSNLVYYQCEMARLATRMELWGVPVCHETRKQIGEKLKGELDGLLFELQQDLSWPEFNPMNKAHAVEAIFSRKYLGLTPKVLTEKTGQPSTKYQDLLDYLSNPIVRKFVTYTEMRHVYASQFGPTGAYSQAIIGNRLYPKWNYAGTKGSRFSSSPNVQNQRKSERYFFKAPDGRCIVGSDKSQLELRIAACLAGVDELIAEMAKPDGDPHRLAAMAAYADFLDRPPDQQKALRNGVKTTVYASLYRGGVETVFKTIRKNKRLDAKVRAALTQDAVSKIYHGYFGKYVEIPIWHDRNYELASTQGYLEIPPLGRRRYFHTQPPPYTEVANWPIQTCGSDVVGMQLVHVQRALDEKYKGSAFIVVHGHDALYVECDRSDAEGVCKIVEREFGHYPLQGPKGIVDLTADIHIGRSLALEPFEEKK